MGATIPLFGLFPNNRREQVQTYVVDIAEGEQRTNYVSVSNTAIGVVLLLTGLLGALAAAFSVSLVILLLALLGIVGVVMGYRLPEA